MWKKILLDNLRKSNILSLSCVFAQKGEFLLFCEIIWISIDSKTILKKRRRGIGGDTAGLKTQRNHLTGNCLFYWKQHSVTAIRTGQEQDWPLTKMQFYRHTRADFLWVTNTPAACQVSKRPEPHSGSDHLEHRPLSAKMCQSKKYKFWIFFHS